MVLAYEISNARVGNIKFIGELFKQKMLTSQIMHNCVMKLLFSSSQEGEDQKDKQPDEEELEALCSLMETVSYALHFATPEMRL